MSSRNRRQSAGVRGPASALTSFLAGLGVEPSARLTTWGHTSNIPGATAETPEDGTQTPDAGPSQSRDTESARPSSIVEEDAEEPPLKRARGASIDSDDLDAIPRPAQEALKAIGEVMDCGECGKSFTVTGYTKEHPKRAMTWLCLQCCYALGIDPFAKPKKPAKSKATAKREERGKVVHYEQKRGVVSLSEVCIQLIGQYIEDVEQLGDIGTVNLDKVCRIISKNRHLTSETAPLFYSIERKELALYDCTRLTDDAFIAMANLCPNLESLSLNLCGRMTSATLHSWTKSLKHLCRLELNGSFLVRVDGWQALFKATGKRLTQFSLAQSPRIDLKTIEIMVKSCPNLTELRLVEAEKLNDEFLTPLSKLKKLLSLDLSAPGVSLNDDALDHFLAAAGKTLTSLNLSDNPELTDAALTSIAKHCPALRCLALQNIDLSDKGVATFFTTLQNKGRLGLETIDLEKGHALSGAALRALIAHSGPSVQKLSLLGWRTVDAEALNDLGRCHSLRELDLGWCRGVTDFSIKEVLDSCNQIQVIKVWGCNQLTDAVPRKKGVQVVGIETHSI